MFLHTLVFYTHYYFIYIFSTILANFSFMASLRLAVARVPFRSALAPWPAAPSAAMTFGTSPSPKDKTAPPPQPKTALDAQSEELVNFYKRQFEAANRDRAKNYRKHRFGLIILGIFLGSLSIGSCMSLLCFMLMNLIISFNWTQYTRTVFLFIYHLAMGLKFSELNVQKCVALFCNLFFSQSLEYSYPYTI